ncbi:MAG: large conductance mechanosensitive channel protein MscL [Eubacteriales bacterium]|nr:large conductance mechanosensitive channel protein MscL [Eubacteriales bacterium]
MNSFMKEFKEFIAKGDVVSMAIGIIIGGAFNKIVNSIVEQLITPLLGIICGGIDFKSLSFGIGEAQFGIGIVINDILTFLATAFVLFLILKAYNKMTPKKEEEKK